MGKHSDPTQPPEKIGTELGIPFEDMSPDQKAFEFDESLDHPLSYARENFPREARSGTPGDPRHAG